MTKRRYVNVNVDVDVDVPMDDIIENMEDDDLMEEVKDRGLLRQVQARHDIDYRSVCDLFGVNYFTPINELIEMLKDRLNSEMKTIM